MRACLRNAPRKIPSVKKCMRCGKESHPREQCPAKDEECHRCKPKGHYEAVCRSKTVAGAMLAEAMDVAFLDNVSPGKQETIWLATIQLNGKQITFKLDTGAEVTAISDATHQRLGKPTLDPTDKLLYGPSRQPLQVLYREVQRDPYPQGNTCSATRVCRQKAEKKPAWPASYHHTDIGSQNGRIRAQPTKRIPQSLQRTREPWTRGHHPAEARRNPLCTPHSSSRCNASPTTSGRRIETNGVHGSNIESR